jgi:hypothetical protein
MADIVRDGDLSTIKDRAAAHFDFRGSGLRRNAALKIAYVPRANRKRDAMKSGNTKVPNEERS